MKKSTRILKKVWRYTLGTLLSFIIIIAVYFLAALGLSYWPTSAKELACEQEHSIYLSNNGVHIDVIIPSETLDPGFVEQLQPPFAENYVALGWGDRGFYLNTPTWDDVRVSTVCNAMLWSSNSVMHVSYYKGTSTNWTEMKVCQDQIDRMVEQMQKSFTANDDGSYQLIEGESYGHNDRFFEANGGYHAFRTCNVWTGQSLKAADIQTSVWSPFTFGIMHHAKAQAP